MNDAYSLKILELLQQDARMPIQQLAEQVGLSSTPCWKRIKQMEAQGLITGYKAQIDRKKAGLELMVLAEVNLQRHTEDTVAQFEAMVQATPQIVRCYSTTGQSDYVLNILAKNIEEYENFLMRTLFKLPGVTHVRSSIVLKEVKQGGLLPL